jgi:putative nucleotidyltransferase with HDIG domain
MTAHLIGDEKPAEYFDKLSCQPLFAQYPFYMLLRQKHTEQSPIHHPEGSVWNHTLLVVNEAARLKDESSDAKAFMWAALLHDIGKPDTTKIRKGKITSYDHDVAGYALAREFLRALTYDDDFIVKTAALVRWHMQILFVVNRLPFADIINMKKETNIHDIALLGFCDRLGRGNADAKKELNNMQIFLERVT